MLSFFGDRSPRFPQKCHTELSRYAMCLYKYRESGSEQIYMCDDLLIAVDKCLLTTFSSAEKVKEEPQSSVSESPRRKVCCD